eukprot:1158454-Pelagomonas_calceolata.AAC.21
MRAYVPTQTCVQRIALCSVAASVIACIFRDAHETTKPEQVVSFDNLAHSVPNMLICPHGAPPECISMLLCPQRASYTYPCTHHPSRSKGCSDFIIFKINVRSCIEGNALLPKQETQNCCCTVWKLPR